MTATKITLTLLKVRIRGCNQTLMFSSDYDAGLFIEFVKLYRNSIERGNPIPIWAYAPRGKWLRTYKETVDQEKFFAKVGKEKYKIGLELDIVIRMWEEIISSSMVHPWEDMILTVGKINEGIVFDYCLG